MAICPSQRRFLPMLSYIVLIFFAVNLLLVQRVPEAQARQLPQVFLSVPVQGSLSDEAVQQDWQFEARAGEQVAILLNKSSGNLDPLVQVWDAEGQILAENDDRLAPLVLDAGLEITFDSVGTYIIRVGRHSGVGDYRLWVIPAYTHVWEDEAFENDLSRFTGNFARQENNRLVIESTPQFATSHFPEGGVALDDFYVQAEFEWVSGNEDVEAAFGFIVRAVPDGTRRPPGYYFQATRDGRFSVLARQNETFTTLLPEAQSPLFNTPRITLGVWAAASRLRFYVNGQLLGEITDVTFGTGIWGFYMRGDRALARVAVDNLLLTRPPSRYRALPAALDSWRSTQVGDVVTELVRLRLLPEEGQRMMIISSLNYGVGPQQERIYLQGDDNDLYSDVMVGVDVTFVEGDNLGCGLATRYVNNANQILAYVDSEGGAGLVQVQDGAILRNTYDLRQTIENPLAGERVRLLVIVRGEYVTFYVDGNKLATEYMPPVTGRIGVAFLNYSTRTAACRFENFWVWR